MPISILNRLLLVWWGDNLSKFFLKHCNLLQQYSWHISSELMCPLDNLWPEAVRLCVSMVRRSLRRWQSCLALAHISQWYRFPYWFPLNIYRIEVMEASDLPFEECENEMLTLFLFSDILDLLYTTPFQCMMRPHPPHLLLSPLQEVTYLSQLLFFPVPQLLEDSQYTWFHRNCEY